MVLAGDEAGRVIRADEPMYVTLGRGEDCVATFDAPGVSRIHAGCVFAAGAYLFSDKGSTNGTYVNGKRIEAAIALTDGDILSLGKHLQLRFSLVDDATRTSLEALHARKRAGTQTQGELEADLEDASAFQTKLLAIPSSIENVTVDALYQPFERVGGDVFQVHALGGDRVRVFIADAVGHGVQAALVTMLLVSEYEASKRLASPVEALAAMSRGIATKYEGTFVQFTGQCFDLYLATGALRVASAAHPPPLIVAPGAVRTLSTGGQFLGLFPEVELHETVTELASGEWVVAHTDGVTDVETREGRMLGDEGHAEVLARAASADRSPSEAMKAAFATYSVRRDDITQVALRWVAP